MVVKTTEGVDSFMVNQENSFKVCHNLMGLLCVVCLLLHYRASGFFITAHIAGVSKRKVMQKGAFAYKGLRNVLVIKTYCKVSILKLVKCL